MELVDFRDFEGNNTKWHEYLRGQIGECQWQISGCLRTPDVVHHEDEDTLNDVLENVVVLCRACHVRHHHTGKKLTAEHKLKLSRVGTRHSAETKAKISSSNAGKKRTAEQKDNIRQGNLGKNRGRTLSDEHKAVLSSKLSGRKLSDETKEKMRQAALKRNKKSS